jgi:hypothetical protein
MPFADDSEVKRSCHSPSAKPFGVSREAFLFSRFYLLYWVIFEEKLMNLSQLNLNSLLCLVYRVVKVKLLANLLYGVLFVFYKLKGLYL